MLPSVSEVLKELTARAPVEPDIAFRAAREVCAEELKRIRDAGGDSVPLEELVQRAFLRATGGRSLEPLAPPAGAVPAAPARLADEPIAPPPLPESAPAVETEAASPPAPVEPAVDDPFSETTGAMDLRWDGEIREPFTEPQPTGPSFLPAPPAEGEEAGGDAGVETAVPPPTTEIPAPFALPADEEPFLGPAASAEVLPEGDRGDGGPGDETLSRLSREAQEIDLDAVFPKPAVPAAVPFALSTQRSDGRAPQPEESAPPPFEDDEDTVLTIPRGAGWSRRPGREQGSRAGRLLGVAVALAALAALGWLLVGLWLERDMAPTPVAVARPRPVAPPSPAPHEPSPAVPGPGAGLPAATPSDGAPVPTAGLPSVPPASESSPPPALAPTRASAPLPTQPPAPPTAVPAATPRRAPAAERSVAPPPVPVTTAAVPRSRDGLVVTGDRAGQPQCFSIHFTSYKDRPSAERDLKRVAGLVGIAGYVAEVDLGEKGTWQRVMIGTYSTAAEAKAVREELAAKGTPNMGWVYRVVGPEGAVPR
jgi:hypothetical protein